MDFTQSRLIRKIEKLKERRKATAEKIIAAMRNGSPAQIDKLRDFHGWLDNRIRKHELTLKRKEKT
jgi:hypothetical protein